MNGAALWEQLQQVAPMMLRALLADMRLVRLTESEAELACAGHARNTAEKKLDDLSKLMTELSGKQIRARLVDSEPEPAASEPSQAPTPDVPPDLDHPVVQKALEVFNGRIIDVKPVRSKPDDGGGAI
ncbi:MAG: hypothetical protein AAFR76_02690 [Planctomycetota bacterium]